MIIRNEADFSEKTTISYNYGKAIMFFFFVFTVSAVTGFFSIGYLGELFSTRDEQRNLGQEVVSLGEKIDSLTVITNNYRESDLKLRELMMLLEDDKIDQ